MTNGHVRLSIGRYLEALDEDARAFRGAAGLGLAPKVPGCPDWAVADLVDHLAGVYQRRVATIRLGAELPEGESEATRPADVELLAWFDASYAELVHELTTRDPSEPTPTWWPGEQSMSFWYRRMAQETAVHRWDAQSAHGVARSIDADIAVDGIDEVLGWLTWPWDEFPEEEATGQVLRVSTDGGAWSVTMEPTRVAVASSGDGSGDGSGPGAAYDALITGAPSALLLHLWGRPGIEGVTDSGDPTTIRLFGERLALITD